MAQNKRLSVWIAPSLIFAVIFGAQALNHSGIDRFFYIMTTLGFLSFAAAQAIGWRRQRRKHTHTR